MLRMRPQDASEAVMRLGRGSGTWRNCCGDGVRGGRGGNRLPLLQTKARWQLGRGRSGQGRCRGVLLAAETAELALQWSR